MSISVSNGIKFLYNFKVERYMPYDFLIKLLRLLDKKRKLVFLLGADNKVLNKAYQNLKDTYPDLRFTRQRGYFKKRDIPQLTEAIRKASPALLITSRGVKGKEFWTLQHQNKFNPGLCIHLNDFFDINAGKKIRPNSTTFEKGSYWITSLLKNPLRFFYMFTLLRYRMLLIYYKLSKKEG
jgi:N-acetylglucosaminyldiphosphoundecaprenol N-acetyl-beta-D-mannosaminyltransferase